MSILGYHSRLLTLRPTIIHKPGILIIKNGFLARLFTLYTYLRRVEIFNDERTVVFRETRFFFFNKTKFFHHSELMHIDYSYGSMGHSWAGPLLKFIRFDQFDSYRISLVTKKKEKITICSYLGEGVVGTGWVGVIFGDSVIDFSGTQENDSRQFASYLSELLDIPIGEQFKISKIEINCPSCGRRISQKASKCYYCGSS